MELVGPIIEIVKFVGSPIVRYLKYYKNFNDYVKKYGKVKEKLQCKHRDIESTLRSQFAFGEIAKEEVKHWLEEVKEITGTVAQNVDEKISEGGCLSLSRASLAKLIDKEIHEMEKLYEEGGKLPESLVLNGASITAIEIPTSELLGSDKVKADILSYLMGDEVTKLGVWGMGGVGKTTIMKHVYNQLLKEAKFKKVIWATVSRTFDVRQLQEEIATFFEETYQKDLAKVQNITMRAAKLSKMLGGHRPYVLILDDVWRSFELTDIGIPQPVVSDGCKLVLTTRSKEVVRTMECKSIEVKTLSPEASLKLFLYKVGNIVLSDGGGIKQTLSSTLMSVVDECDGLPLAIVTVAGSMKGISDPLLWSVALHQLREHRRNMAGTEDDEFRVLKFSYDWLKDQMKSCFLYCALYPEDHKIPTEEIIEYWIEEGLIEVMETRQAMKDEGHAILRKLEDNCLLEFVEGRKEYVIGMTLHRATSGPEFGEGYVRMQDCVRMHDVVRDMALHVTRKSPRFLVKAGLSLKVLPGEHEWKEDVLKVSLMYNNIEEIPSTTLSRKCPMLTTLLLSHNRFSTIPEAFFDRMLGLRILDLSYNEMLSSLPNSVSKLVNLTSLLLLGCKSLSKVPSLSNLGVLEKLDLSGTGIEGLPQGLEMLTNLKYLNFSALNRYGGRVLPEIPDGMLPNLSKLEHLEVDCEIALKEEVGKLLKLEGLCGWFPTVDELTTFFFKSRRHGPMNCYDLCVGCQTSYYQSSLLSRLQSSRSHTMKSIIFLGVNLCEQPNFVPSGVQRLVIDNCDFLLESLESVPSKSAQPPAIFSSLQQIHISFCLTIKKLFPLALLGDLQNLESIKVIDCPQLEEIISTLEAPLKLTLPKLKLLLVARLPLLKRICSSTSVLICDSLVRMVILECQMLQRIPLYLPLLDNGQPSPPPSLRNFVVWPTQWWESLEWDHPDAKKVLSGVCHYLHKSPQASIF